MSVGGGLREPHRPSGDEGQWKLTVGEWVFFGALVFLYVILLVHAPQLALLLVVLFGDWIFGVYVGYKARGNRDFERYVGRWLT